MIPLYWEDLSEDGKAKLLGGISPILYNDKSDHINKLEKEKDDDPEKIAEIILKKQYLENEKPIAYFQTSDEVEEKGFEDPIGDNLYSDELSQKGKEKLGVKDDGFVGHIVVHEKEIVQ